MIARDSEFFELGANSLYLEKLKYEFSRAYTWNSNNPTLQYDQDFDEPTEYEGAEPSSGIVGRMSS